MQQQASVITLGVGDLRRSRRFYTNGFGWVPVFENDEIIFYQMNGLVLGTWLAEMLDDDMQRQMPAARRPLDRLGSTRSRQTPAEGADIRPAQQL